MYQLVVNLERRLGQLNDLNPYIFHISLYDLASLGTLFVGLAFALLLGFAKRLEKAAKLFLSPALVVIVLKTGELTPLLLPALGPLLYFYVQRLTCPDRRFCWKDMLHFCILLVAYWMPVWMVLISVVIYLYLSHRLIQDFYSRLPPVLMDRPRFVFRRLDRTLFLLGLLCMLSLFSDPLILTVALVLIGMAADAMLKPNSDIQQRMPITDRSDVREKSRRLKEVVVANRLYEDAELTLNTLAVKLNIHPHDLSRIINMGLEKNFNDFINDFRVREVARKMQDPAYDRLTLLGIAYESGFNSERTFHRVFKEVTGKTPLEYKNTLRKELPIDKLASLPGIRPVILRSGSLPNWVPLKLNRNYMFKNHIKTACRNMLHNKVYSTLNIVGLAAGMAVALLIGLWVYSQVSYDRFLSGYQLAYKVRYNTHNNGEINTGGSTNLPLAEVLKKDFPEIRYVAQTDWMGSHPLSVGDKRINVNGTMAGSDFLKIFQYPLVQGNVSTVLSDPYSIVLSQSAAKALFGSADPVGKMVKIDNFHDLRVTGILKDVPVNSTLQFSFIVPFSYYVATDDGVKNSLHDWNNNSFQTFVALQPNAAYAELAHKLKGTLVKYSPKYFAQTKAELFLEPLKDWHLYTEYRNGVVSGGLIDYVRMFALIGILVLVIACINFTNLATARSEKRAREVGVRKAIGSSRKDLILQFLTESMTLSGIAFLLSLVFVVLALPAFNNLTRAAISLPFTSGLFWLVMLTFVILTGLLSGSRPAFYLSSFNPVKVLKGNLQTGKAGNRPREILVVLQFSWSIALIISTLIIYQQLQHAKDRPVGYDASRLVMSDATGDLTRNYGAFKNEMLASGVVTSVTKSSSPVTELWASNSVTRWSGQLPGETLSLAIIGVSDADYFKTLGMEIKSGRNFTGNLGADSLSVVLNEAAVKRMRYKEPVGQVITWHTVQQRATVVGVVKDALMASPFSGSVPTIFIYQPGWSSVVTYRLAPRVNTRAALAKLAPIFSRYNPSIPFQYHFVDESYASKFDFESLIGKLAGLFASLAILISCIGLFGLAAYTAEKRTKEIGIRKVLGASVPQVWLLLSKEFVVLVVISCLIASPVSWYYLHEWLLKYEYRISIGPGVFILSGLAAIIITLFTISFQAIRAALANPVKSLRSE